MGTQAVVVRLPASLAREVTSWVHRDDGGYESISEFATVAFANQLALERDQPTSLSDDLPPSAGPVPGLLDSVPASPPEGLSTPIRPSAPLFVLTNRMNPMKVAVRVLANMRLSGAWPEVEAFQYAAAREARHVGRALRVEDDSQRRKSFQRRWVAYPIGKDEQSALDRYVASFTLADGVKGPTGPLAILGLAGVEDGLAKLTSSGWRLAAAPSPLLDAEGVGTLSEEERELLAAALTSSGQEADSVRAFVDAVEEASGSQGEVDRVVQRENPDWSDSQVQSFRSAHIGRLSDLGLLTVTGRGSSAHIELAEHCRDLFADDVGGAR